MMNVMRAARRASSSPPMSRHAAGRSAITHVRFDMPKFAETNCHRIGRTGRAGASGTAISFVNRNDMQALQKIERFIGHKVNVSTVVGMEARFKPGMGKPARPAGKPAGKFGGKSAFGKPAGAADRPWQSRKPASHTPHHAAPSGGRSSRTSAA
jgi:superfamily II DNA/RNA helicase